MPIKKRRVLNGKAEVVDFVTCKYKLTKLKAWVAIERLAHHRIFVIGMGSEEANVAVPTMEMPYEMYLECDRLLCFSNSTRDRPGRARVTVVSKLLRQLRKARYGAATEFGVLLRKLFEKTKLEEE